MSLTSFIAEKWAKVLDETKKYYEENPKPNSAGDAKSSESQTKEEAKISDPLEELENFIVEQYSALEDNGGKPQLPSVPEYRRMDESGLTDEEIKTRATENLAGYANAAKSAVDEEISSLDEKYNADKSNAKKDYDKHDVELGKIYGAAKENASNDMLKRGLARSSISANIVGSLEKGLADERVAVLNAYVAEVSALDKQISGLESKRKKAMSDYNVAYAVKLTDEINTLTAERDKKQNEAVKYNNSLAEKEHQQHVDKQMKESDLYSEQLSQSEKEKVAGKITSEQQRAIYEAIYNKMEEVLSSMSKQDAKKLLQSSNIFQSGLNDYYYYKLYDKYGR